MTATWTAPRSVFCSAGPSNNRLVAEYALRDIHKPIGVAELQLTRLLPEDLRGTLPTVEDLERELQRQTSDAPSGQEAGEEVNDDESPIDTEG